MATQKIGLTKLGLKKNTNLIQLDWNGQIIEIKEYLPIDDKMKLIENIFNKSIDSNSNVANLIQTHINTVLEIIFTYTNINFTDKQKEDRLNLFDLLVSSGLADAIFETLKDTGECEFIEKAVKNMENEFYEYKNSVLGILDAVNQDYSNVSLDAENIQKNLADPENLTLLKDIVTKLG